MEKLKVHEMQQRVEAGASYVKGQTRVNSLEQFLSTISKAIALY